jgi:hypothetical protein
MTSISLFRLPNISCPPVMCNIIGVVELEVCNVLLIKLVPSSNVPKLWVNNALCYHKCDILLLSHINKHNVLEQMGNNTAHC